MKFSYARVSTLDQNLNRQIEVFKKFCSEIIFTEKLLGKNISETVVFQEAIQLIREGD